MGKVLIHHPVLGLISVDQAERWDVDVVSERMIEAFRTLARTPTSFGPRAYGSAMPKYIYEWSDFLAQAETEIVEAGAAASDQVRIANALRDTWETRNETRALPTAAEIDRMNESLAWPMRYLGDEPEIAEVVNIWCLFAARQDDDVERFERWCDRRKTYPELMRLMARMGMGLIGVELNMIGAPI